MKSNHILGIRHNSSETHFGFKKIPKEQKETLVAQVFKSVASQYDLMNDFMSVGVHRLWKDYFIRQLSPTMDMKLLDVAGGTGDITFKFLDYLKDNYGSFEERNVTVLDINPEMLKFGKQRALQKGLNNIQFIEGNAEHLDAIESESIDVYTIAFGIRNCTNIDKVIREAYRVLKPGGRFMVLEFSHVENPLLAKMYDMHSFYVIPALGEFVANDRSSYQYLVESIRRFPKQEEFASMIEAEGFKTIGDGYENLNCGIAAIHSGYKI